MWKKKVNRALRTWESNICILGIPEGKEKNCRAEKYLNKKWLKTPKFGESPVHKPAHSRSQTNFILEKKQISMHRHVIFKLEEKILKAVSEELCIAYIWQFQFKWLRLCCQKPWWPKGRGTMIWKCWKKNYRCTFHFFLFLIFFLFLFPAFLFHLPFFIFLYVTWPVTSTSTD